MKKRLIMSCTILVLVVQTLFSTPVRDISVITYESRSNGVELLIVENTLIINSFPEHPLIFNPGVKIYEDSIWADVEVGTVLIWPNNSYSQATYSFGFPVKSKEGESASFLHTLAMDLTYEMEKYLLTGGTKGYFESDKLSGLFFIGYRRFLKEFSLWGRGTMSMSSQEGLNGSFWGDLEWMPGPRFVFNCGFIAGGFKPEDSSSFSGMELGGIAGIKYYINRGALRYLINITHNSEYLMQSHSLVLDLKL